MLIGHDDFWPFVCCSVCAVVAFVVFAFRAFREATAARIKNMGDSYKG